MNRRCKNNRRYLKPLQKMRNDRKIYTADNEMQQKLDKIISAEIKQ